MMEKPPDTFKCYLVSWDEVYRLAKILAFKIKCQNISVWIYKTDLQMSLLSPKVLSFKKT
ncbi:hypothetical protein METP1_03033 [Methanosarcinales archaeon]|nr:hypothetical protein METP1_03033 [Methanosarcinales archaeon]